MSESGSPPLVTIVPNAAPSAFSTSGGHHGVGRGLLEERRGVPSSRHVRAPPRASHSGQSQRDPGVDVAEERVGFSRAQDEAGASHETQASRSASPAARVGRRRELQDAPLQVGRLRPPAPSASGRRTSAAPSWGSGGSQRLEELEGRGLAVADHQPLAAPSILSARICASSSDVALGRRVTEFSEVLGLQGQQRLDVSVRDPDLQERFLSAPSFCASINLFSWRPGDDLRSAIHISTGR